MPFGNGWNRNSGYVGNKMSVRAKEAYDDGEMPLSKWTKSDIIDRIEELIDDYDIQIKFDINTLNKLTKSELIDLFLYQSSWHHTGKYFNQTDFYDVDQDRLEDVTTNDILRKIQNRTPRTRTIKVKEKPMYVTALVRYTIWVDTRGRYGKYKKQEYVEEIVRYMSDAKLVKTSNGNKRLSNFNIIFKVEQKTKFVTNERFNQIYKSSQKKYPR